LPNNNPLQDGNLTSGEIGEALAIDLPNEKRNLLLVARSVNKPEQLYNHLAKSLASKPNT
jgi:short-subunit dehydrogenase